MEHTILVVEDEQGIREAIGIYMKNQGYNVILAANGKEGLEKIETNDIHLAIVDIMMPVMDGISMVMEARKHHDFPILFLSAKSEDIDKITGLNIGADDYITKPFRPLVLGAKVKALIRRNKDLILNHSDVLECGPFSYHSSTMRFYRNGEELTLSARESAILLLFLRHPNQVFTKEMIYEQVWGNSVIVDDNAIMVYINRLRSKIEDDKQKPRHIVTVRGLGYRFVP